MWNSLLVENLVNDLAQMALFYGIASNEIGALLDCVAANVVTFKKGDIIIEAGSEVAEFGIMLSGQSRSIKWDQSGRLIIITFIEKGDVLGVMRAAKADHPSPVFVEATMDSTVMFIPFSRVIARCEKNCFRHEQFLQNYISEVAEKGLELYERINCLLEPTVRDKILVFLSRISRDKQSKSFEIPMDRNAMAEYLNIERSSLSRELSRMKRDGLIEYNRSSFSLLI